MTARKSILTLVIIALLTAGCIYLISKLKFSYDFEAFFPKGDPETEFYYNFRKTFETDNDFIIVALENDGSIYDSEFLKQADSLANELREVPDITEVQSITRINEYQRDPVMGQVFELPLLRIAEPENYAIDSVRIAATPGMVGLFVSSDARSIAINMKHTAQLSKERCDTLSHEVQRIVAEFHFEKPHIIGRALGQRLYVELMIEELLLFISLSLVLTVIFLFIAFRSGWGLVIPTLVVLMGIVWTLGFIKIIGKDLDLMLTVLPTILFVVGMSDSVHVLTKYMQELRNGRDKTDAIIYAFKSIRLATFLTALTTAIGFLTLIFSNIQPISDFGIYTSVGVLLAYGLTYTILPAILFLAKPKKLYLFATSEDFWTRKLHRALFGIFKKKRWVMAGTVLVLALSAWGIARIHVDNKMLEDLRDTHLLKREFNFMEEHFSGCRPFEMAIKLESDSQAFSPPFLQDLDTIGFFLKEEYAVGSLLSMAEIMKSGQKAMNAGQQEFYTLPADDYETERILKLLKRKELKQLTKLYYNESDRMLRISGKVADTGRNHYDSLNQKLNKFIAENCQTKFAHHVTGTAHLIDLNNKSLVENMVWDLLLSITVIGLVMGAVYKSWRMVLLTIIPNTIPLLIVGGIMGWAGIPIKVSTSIIFNIAFGIAVDDTIHFLARVRTLLRDGYNVLYAVKRTFLTTGKAMIVTTLILSGGFLTLILSDFLGTFYIGFLISLTLFIAIFCELLITPLLVIFFYRKK
ncbi:MAG: efflux RND transporter permease subunit [Flavobacteriales bacterium]